MKTDQYLLCLKVWIWMIVTMFIIAINNIGIAHYSGFSMCPTLSMEGTTITQEAKEYGVGDIVTFEKKGILVNHRIVGVLDDTFIIQPDSFKSITERGWTAKQDIVNKSKIISKDLLVISYPWARCPDFSKMSKKEYIQLWDETYGD